MTTPVLLDPPTPLLRWLDFDDAIEGLEILGELAWEQIPIDSVPRDPTQWDDDRRDVSAR